MMQKLEEKLPPGNSGADKVLHAIFAYRHTSLLLKLSDREERNIADTRKYSIFKTQQAFN